MKRQIVGVKVPRSDSTYKGHTHKHKIQLDKYYSQSRSQRFPFLFHSKGHHKTIWRVGIYCILVTKIVNVLLLSE